MDTAGDARREKARDKHSDRHDRHNTKSMAFENVRKHKAFEIRGPSKETLIFETSAMHDVRAPASATGKSATDKSATGQSATEKSDAGKSAAGKKCYWK